MNNIFIELTEFIKSGALGPSLTPLEEQLGTTKLRIAIIKLLGWLKIRSRTKGGHPLVITDEFEWAGNLRRVVAEVEALRQIFVIDGNDLDFSEGFTENEREELLSFIYGAYQPRLMT